MAGPSPEAQSRGNTALILSIVGILCCNLLSPVAFFMGLSARREGAGANAVAAMVIGGIGMAGMVLSLIYLIVMLAATGGTGTPPGFPTP